MKNAAIVPDVFDVSVFKPEVISDAQLRECVDFRNEIYLEQGYLPEAANLNDPDQYDKQSSHVCVRNMENGRLSAYCRMIYNAPLPLPICVLCPDLENQIDTPVEISRFSVRANWRGHMSVKNMAPIFLLTHALFRVSREECIASWSCVIDIHFQQLCQRFFKMHFQVLGEPVDYFGSPCIPSIIQLADTIRNNMPNPDFLHWENSLNLKTWMNELDRNES